MPRILNAGVERSRGEYVMFGHDHDLYGPALFSELAGALDRHPSASFAFGGSTGVDPTGTRETARWVLDLRSLSPGRMLLAQELLPRLDIPVPALSMLRRSFFGERYLDPRFGGSAYLELWLRLAAAGDVAYVRNPLLRLRERDASSVFVNAGCEMTARVLEARREYLAYAGDAPARRRIKQQWQRAVDQSALALIWRALEAGHPEEVEGIVGLARREGSASQHRAVLFSGRRPGQVIGVATGLR
jgi:hypothetical protein